MAERRLQRARTALAEGQRLIDAGSTRAAVEPLERARADFAAELDLEGVRDVRTAAERGYHESAEDEEPFYEQLLYASAQNVRFLSRREAARRGVEWVDPHPELDQPGRPEIRIERGISRGAKRWIVAVALVVLLALTGTIVGIVLSLDHGTLVNDTPQSIEYVDCGGSVSDEKTLPPGERVHFSGWSICVRVEGGGLASPRCIDIGDGETASVSDGRPCD